MTKEMQELIDRELNAALESGDAKLAAARARRQAESGVVSNVTATVTAGK